MLPADAVMFARACIRNWVNPDYRKLCWPVHRHSPYIRTTIYSCSRCTMLFCVLYIIASWLVRVIGLHHRICRMSHVCVCVCENVIYSEAATNWTQGQIRTWAINEISSETEREHKRERTREGFSHIITNGICHATQTLEQMLFVMRLSVCVCMCTLSVYAHSTLYRWVHYFTYIFPIYALNQRNKNICSRHSVCVCACDNRIEMSIFFCWFFLSPDTGLVV